ncbi:hypothetical protein [Sphingomonas solaris]|uniref:Uncharacterized protein n=1 Tax=Alterirhizorhabdus solaris TaxID=2529389 RepID=A0A558RAE8_9SPHN|nr:hypothetical protein [Sphingomonas solaris]TVV76341.1 hypothetical protein FOY91_04725 [Sphingomonas solaris]
MTDTRRLADGLEAALATARAEYRRAVILLAGQEADKDGGATREPADVDHIHHARTRVLALEAAREELSRPIDAGDRLGT